MSCPNRVKEEAQNTQRSLRLLPPVPLASDARRTPEKTEPGGIRTHDLRIKSPLLYQLSYELQAKSLKDVKEADPEPKVRGMTAAAILPGRRRERNRVASCRRVLREGRRP